MVYARDNEPIQFVVILAGSMDGYVEICIEQLREYQKNC